MSQQKAPFLIDANIFIEPKNRFYPFDYCPAYWDLLMRSYSSGRWTTTQDVYREVVIGNDDLADWMKTHFRKKDFIDCAKEPDVLARYNEVFSYVKKEPRYSAGQLNAFFAPNVADPWLVARAMSHDECIVTHDMRQRGKVSLADVCDYFSVRHITVFDFIRAEKVLFELR